MIDWSAFLCGHGSPAVLGTYVPHLLRAFLAVIVHCDSGKRVIDQSAFCYPPQTVRVGQLTYTTAPLGVVVSGVNLSQPVADDVINQIKRDVHLHRVLIFKNQGHVPGERQVEISRWFGEMEYNYIGHHPASPHKDVVRLSNSPNVGYVGVGAYGWHVDGTNMKKPSSIAMYHIVSAARGANTEFVPLTDLVDSLPAERRSLWERMWRIDIKGRTFPLIYSHPVTSHPTMLFNTALYKAYTFILDHGTDQAHEFRGLEADSISQAINEEIEKDNQRLVYSHKWEEGDILITDNLALGHKPATEAMEPPSKIGLRILHRTTVEGKWKPEQDFSSYARQAEEGSGDEGS